MSDHRLAPRVIVQQGYGLPHPLVLLMLVAAMFGMTYAVNSAAAGVEPTPQRAAQLAYMVRQDCGSCHGMTLAGGLGPSLLPAALNGKPADYLKLLILDGRTGTAMPGWSPLLSAADAEWIAQRLLKGFPDAR